MSNSCPVLYPLPVIAKTLGVSIAKLELVKHPPLAFSKLNKCRLYRVTLTRSMNGETRHFNTYWYGGKPKLLEILKGLSFTHALYDCSEDFYVDFGLDKTTRISKAIHKLLGVENMRLRVFLGDTDYVMFTRHCDRQKS
jgi:hypothetical protein